MGSSSSGSSTSFIEPNRPGIPAENNLGNIALFSSYSTYPYTLSPWRSVDYAKNWEAPRMVTPAYVPPKSDI